MNFVSSRRSLLALAPGLVLGLAACGGGESSTPTTGGGGAGSSPPPAAGGAATSATSATSATTATGAGAATTATGAPSTTTGAAGVIEIPAAAGLPVKTVPLIPGGKAEKSSGITDSSPVQSFRITAPGKSGRQIAEWYAQTLPTQGYNVGNPYPNGGFGYKGNGVQGEAIPTSTILVFGMSKAP